MASNSRHDKTLTPEELNFIEDACEYLENPSFLIRLADMFGKPLALLTKGVEKLAPEAVENAVGRALRSVMTLAVRTIPTGDNETSIGDKIGEVGASSDFWHKISVAVTGTAGGFFGFIGLPIELPITTAIMFRSIAAIAKDFNENLADDEVRMQCLSVLSYGGPKTNDDVMGSTYLSSRIALDETIALAAKAVAGKTGSQIAKMIEQGTAPAVVNLIARIANRFNIAVTEKLVAQSLPVLGAAAGGTINVAFMDHFNRVARYHFGIRVLERKYGQQFIQSVFQEAVQKQKRFL